ncbi:type II toxin-antitoxin system VapB family antitoxin [Cyclobacterium sp. SYSU L10401]|uniref:type II toxin-antitoxin system VapB family antitoxin n=1 Tax=Cyclobacterium sp. SYSU L10401 TaxID=2678657 RepID=UPI0013D32900|nr:type II toxin-antitoxin system VapB family antitoxin [Cyclobacterium sp. SYSU L10401]
MRTTLEIPEKLIKEAMELTGAKTKSQLIKEALEDQIARIKRKRLIAYKGTIDLEIDLDDLRKR